MALSVEQFVTEIETMSVLDLNNLVKALETKFGVSAAMMAAPAAAAGPAAAAAAPVEEQTEFTVVLKEAGSNKINVIKVVREVNSSLGLKERGGHHQEEVRGCRREGRGQVNPFPRTRCRPGGSPVRAAGVSFRDAPDPSTERTADWSAHG